MNFAFCENSNQSLGSGVPNGKTKETCLRLCTKVEWTGKKTALLAYIFPTCWAHPGLENM